MALIGKIVNGKFIGRLVADTIEEEGLTELEQAGLDPEKLGFMRGEERRLVLVGAGLNPEEYDF